MPMLGISLVGFMREDQAVDYFRTMCVPADPSYDALRAEFESAKASLGPAMPRAGRPEIAQIPTEFIGYLTRLRKTWPVIETEAWDQKVVEIEPLLATQPQICLPKVDGYGGGRMEQPSFDELLNVCLPAERPAVQPPTISAQNQSIVMRTENMNIKLLYHGSLRLPGEFGILVGPGAPLVKVLKFNGRYYLANGFHRAFALRRRGATHLPCIFKEICEYRELGIEGPTFDRSTMESSNSPTLGHFTQNRAYPVSLRKANRIIHISWSQHTIAEG